MTESLKMLITYKALVRPIKKRRDENTETPSITTDTRRFKKY